MTIETEACIRCGAPNHMPDIFPYCAQCLIDLEKAV